MAPGIEARQVVFGSVHGSLREGGVKLAPRNRRRRAAETADHIHRAAALLSPDLQPFHIVGLADGFAGGVEAAQPRVVVGESAHAGEHVADFAPDRPVHNLPEVFPVAEKIRYAEGDDLRHTRLQHGRRGFGEVDLVVLHLFEALGLGTDHAGRINLDFEFSAGEFMHPFRHPAHRHMHRVVGRKSVPELQDSRAPVCGSAQGRTDVPRITERQQQHGDQGSPDQLRCQW